MITPVSVCWLDGWDQGVARLVVQAISGLVTAVILIAAVRAVPWRPAAGSAGFSRVIR